jgi:hypothetical protein
LPVLEEIVSGRSERRLYVYRGGQHSWNGQFIREMNREIAEFTEKIDENSSKMGLQRA